MKILYLCLKNFSNIYAARNKKSIEIDFSKSKNRITLFIGGNGTGKTSVLSELHPFAYSGNMDVRNNTSLILKGEDGYKEIHIQDDNHIYKIKHHYLSKKDGSISLKSYIEKDGVELNLNGNVTSFKDIVKAELTVDPSYLVLLRLGSNVKNFIDLGRSERKVFISSKLQDVSIYNDYMKNVSTHERYMKSQMKVLEDKIKSLHISDCESFEDNIRHMDSLLKSYRKKLSNFQEDKGRLDGIITTALNGKNKDEVLKRLDDITDNIKRLSTDVDKLIVEEKSIPAPDGADDKMLEEIKNKLQKDKIDQAVIKERYDTSCNIYKEFSDRVTQLNIEIDKYKSPKDLENLNDRYENIQNEMKSIVEEYKDIIDADPKYTKEMLIQYLNVFRTIDGYIEKIYEFPNDSIKSTFELFGKKKSPKELLDNEEKDIYIQLENAGLKNKVLSRVSIPILYIPEACNVPTCPLSRIATAIKDKTSVEEMVVLENRLDKINHMRSILALLESIKVIFDTNRIMIDFVGLIEINDKIIMNAIISGESIRQEEKITKHIQDVEGYSRYMTLKSDAQVISQELLKYKETGNVKALKKELSIISAKMVDKVNEVDQLSMELRHLDMIIYEHETNISLIEEKKIISGKISDIHLQLTDLNSERNDIIEMMSTIQTKIDELNSIEENIIKYNEYIAIYEERLFEDTRKLISRKEMVQELQNIGKEYMKIDYIRKSITPKEGIPLIYIRMFFRDIERDINELLYIVYDDELYIDKFLIEEDSFQIPYVRNGILIEDVVNASQGESSFISLALSFSISSKAMTRYNIPLLDEVDSTLDTTNRALFIDILERYMEKNGIEQVFMITHNNMFDSYPVDVVQMSQVKTELLNQNVIFS